MDNDLRHHLQEADIQVAKSSRSKRLADFAAWVHTHLSGDEKGEAQIFLDHLFRAFDWPGLKEAGATCEVRIKKDTRGTSFADLVWKPIVLIEMKKRGSDLSKHYRQAFDYWTRLVPGRPRYAILCNFDEFWIYDFETQLDSPVDIVKLDDLSARFGPLAFMFPGDESPVFGNHHESVTRKAADKLAECFNSIVRREYDRDLAQRFILQTLMAMFAQDIGLLEPYTLSRVLESCKKPSDSYDKIGALFLAMNTKNIKGGQFKSVPYFNGGLFLNPAQLELSAFEIDLLHSASEFDWSKVRPEIFGTLFEHSLNQQERNAFGAHFTSSVDIMKIIVPTISEPWKEQVESAKTLARLRELLVRLQKFKVLDPACGSGNFLYLAYRETKRIEARIYERMAEEYKSVDPKQRPLGFVTARNFFGIDINEFAVEIAKVTMMLANKLAIEEFHITENPLPLDNLSENFWSKDALVDSQGKRTPWPDVDVIIGNPPFLGAKKLKPQRGADYAQVVRSAYPEVPGMADYCVYWFRKAHDHLPACVASDPLSGRAGLVGTQNIRSSQHRVGGLDHITSTGTIIDAVDNQPWSGEAAVNVSIVNWVKSQSEDVVPQRKRLWFKPTNFVMRSGNGKSRTASTSNYELDSTTFRKISSALSGGTDTRAAQELFCNVEPQKAFQGVTPGHSGFVISEAEKTKFLKKDAKSNDVIFPYLIGNELVTGTGKPQRYLIDFQPRSVHLASKYKAVFEHVEASVLAARLKKAQESDAGEVQARTHHVAFLKRWWRLSWERSEMVSEISNMRKRYIVCSRVTKRPIFEFVSSSIRPGDRLQTFMFDDDYSFGILQSSIHWKWFVARCPKQTERFIYTTEEVFNTFPWPQNASLTQMKSVAQAARKLRAYRRSVICETENGLRGLYKSLELPGENPLEQLHSELDSVVMDAYEFSTRKDTLKQLLDLNIHVAKQIGSGSEMVGPGLSKKHSSISDLFSSDCIS